MKLHVSKNVTAILHQKKNASLHRVFVRIQISSQEFFFFLDIKSLKTTAIMVSTFLHTNYSYIH